MGGTLFVSLRFRWEVKVWGAKGDVLGGLAKKYHCPMGLVTTPLRLLDKKITFPVAC